MARKFNKKRNNNRPRKGKINDRILKEDTKIKDDRIEASNDAKWYTGDTNMTFDAGRFNWMMPNGSVIDGIPNNNWTFPGVLSLDVYPSVGVSVDANSVVNVAARKLFTWIRRSKSNYGTYDPSDLMQYCIAVGHVYMYLNWMIRIYGLLNVYSQLNRYIPEVLIRANGVNPDTIKEQMADFLFYINKFGSLIGSLAIPSTLPYFQRLNWMYSNVYTDDQTGKSTMFEFTPAGFYRYDEANAQLVWEPTAIGTATTWDLTDIVQYGDALTASVLQSQDFWNISADILNAYGEDNIMHTVGVPVDYNVMPVFDLEVLSQIQNTWLCGSPSVTQHANDITQDSNGQLIYNPRFAQGSSNNQIHTGCASIWAHGKRVVNMYKDEVTPEDTFVATRLIPTFKLDSNVVYMTSSGTEFIGNARIWYFDVTTTSSGTVRNISHQLFNRYLHLWNSSSTLNASVAIRCISILSMLSNTSYHPHVVFGQTTNVNSVETFDKGREIGDVANFTIMDDNDITKLHETALYSLFNVPTLGGFKG